MTLAAAPAFLLALIAAPIAMAQPLEVAGDWKGTLSVGAASLRLGVHVDETTTFDSLDQGAKRMPATSTFSDGRFVLTVTGVGVFEGMLSADGQRIAGTWKQGAGGVPLVLERGSFETAQRPQTPRAPFPYRSEDVTYDNPAAPGVKLAGTLTLPQGARLHPATIIISGSGPQDRDGTVFEHKAYLVLADHLTRNGIAVLRVDDRGVGASTGATAADTSADFADDVAAGVAFLRTRPEIDARRIGLIGHSEGGIIAPMVAARDPAIAFLVLWAGQSVSGRDVVVEQVRIGATEAGAGPAQAEISAGVQGRLLDAIIAAPNAPAARTAAAGVLASVGQPASEATLQQLTSDWYRYFIAYDPAPVLRAIEAPVLAMLGERDTQVTPRQNLEAFELAFAGKDGASVVVLAELNHFFQTATTGSVQEYRTTSETISPLALDAMTGWIRRQAGLAPSDQPAPPPAGAIVDSFEMVPDRTVIFAPRPDGTMRIVKVTDKNRLAPMPRNAGEVVVAMTYALKIGAVIEFNSGLDHAFQYEAHALGAGDTVKIPTCPVRGNAVASDQWPQGYGTIRIGPLTRVENNAACKN